MAIIILNKIGSLVSLEKEVGVVWSAVLFAKRIHYYGLASVQLDFKRAFDVYDEEQKVNIVQKSYKKILNPFNNPKLNNDTIAYAVINNYKKIKILRKKRNKSKEELIVLLRREDLLLKHYSMSKDYFHDWGEICGIIELEQFTGFEDEFLIRVHYLTEYYDGEEFLGDTITSLSHSILWDMEFQMFSDEVESLLLINKDVNETSAKNTKDVTSVLPYFTSIKLFDIPDCRLLNAVQLSMYKECIGNIPELFDAKLTDLQNIVKEYTYENENIYTLHEIIKEKLLNDIEVMQEEILKGLFDKTDLKKSDRCNTVYLCMSSYDNVIDIYKDLKIFKDALTISYVKENVGKEIDLNRVRLFLYTKTF